MDDRQTNGSFIHNLVDFSNLAFLKSSWGENMRSLNGESSRGNDLNVLPQLGLKNHVTKILVIQ